MSQNPYNPGALEGGAPPPYHASGPPPAYSQYAPNFSYPAAGPPPQPGFQGPPVTPSAPPQPGFGPPPTGAPFQPQAGYQANFPMQPPGQRGAIIRNISSGLVLDASEYDVKLQHYSGSPYQIWITEPVGDGRFMLKNQGNGAVLDIEGGPDSGAHLITYEKHGGDNQQWYINNPDRTIVSAAANLAIDICEGNCVPGNFLIAYDRHGGDNQQFQVQYQ